MGYLSHFKLTLNSYDNARKYTVIVEDEPKLTRKDPKNRGLLWVTFHFDSNGYIADFGQPDSTRMHRKMQIHCDEVPSTWIEKAHAKF